MVVMLMLFGLVLASKPLCPGISETGFEPNPYEVRSVTGTNINQISFLVDFHVITDLIYLIFVDN